MIKLHLLTYILLLQSLVLTGQNILTLNRAAELTVSNNFSIRLAYNNIRIAENNATKEFTGYNPFVDLAVGPSATFGGSRQKFSNDMTAETSNALSWTAGATLSAGYTFFDKSRDVTLDQLKGILDLANLQLRQSIEDNLFQMVNQYYLIAQLAENIDVLEKSLEISQKRIELAQVNYEYGQGLRLNVLNAEIDLKRDSVNLLNALQQIDEAKRNFNFLVGVPVETKFEIDDQIEIKNVASKEEYILSALAENVTILLSNQNQKVNEFDLKIIDALGKPRIAANANLNYNYQNNAPGSFITSSSNQGLNLGVNLNWNIFDGGIRNIQKQNALINIENESIQKEQIENQLKRDISNTWEAFQNALFILDVEGKSITTAQANLDRTSELFNRGQVTSVEFRQAQLNQINAQLGLNTAKYSAKLLEIQLAYLSGQLLDADL